MPRRETLVFDSTPLIALSSAGFVPQIPRLGVRILIAEEVRQEVAGEGRGPRSPDELLLRQSLREGGIEVARVRDVRKMRRVLENPRLSKADAASLCLAAETKGRLVADDRDLRAAARASGVALGGSLYVLRFAVERKVVTPQDAVRTVERMIDAGWYCSPALLKSFADFTLGPR